MTVCIQHNNNTSLAAESRPKLSQQPSSNRNIQEISYSNNKEQKNKYKDKSTESISCKLRQSLLPILNPVHMQGLKGVPTFVWTKEKPAIPSIHTLRIRTLADSLLLQPHHIFSGATPIHALNILILQGRVPKLVSEQCNYRVI